MYLCFRPRFPPTKAAEDPQVQASGDPRARAVVVRARAVVVVVVGETRQSTSPTVAVAGAAAIAAGEGDGQSLAVASTAAPRRRRDCCRFIVSRWRGRRIGDMARAPGGLGRERTCRGRRRCRRGGSVQKPSGGRGGGDAAVIFPGRCRTSRSFPAVLAWRVSPISIGRGPSPLLAARLADVSDLSLKKPE